MSDALGRLHVHLHARSVKKLWRDEEWAALTSESLLKDDKEFESELLAMARPKMNHDNLKGDDDDSFGDVLTARRAIQIMEQGPNRSAWTDRGHQRLLSMANNDTPSTSAGPSTGLSFSMSNVILR